MLAVVDGCCDCLSLVAMPLDLLFWAADHDQRGRRGDSRLINLTGMLANGWGRCCLLLAAVLAVRTAAVVAVFVYQAL